MFTARELIVSIALWGIFVAILVGTSAWSITVAVVAIIIAAAIFDWIFRAPAREENGGSVE